MVIARREGWERRLAAFVAENAGRRFRFGEWDCCRFAMGAIEALTGVRPEWRGPWKRTAFVDGVDAVTRELGLREIPVAEAAMGDLIQYSRRGLAVAADEGMFVVCREGLRIATPTFGVRAFRV